MCQSSDESDADFAYQCPVCGTEESCNCCERCGAERLEDCECCPHCHGVGQRPLLSGYEWDYIGSDYGECPDCRGTGMR